MAYDPTAAADPFDPATDLAKCYSSYPTYPKDHRIVQMVGHNFQAKTDTETTYIYMLKHPH